VLQVLKGQQALLGLTGLTVQLQAHRGLKDQQVLMGLMGLQDHRGLKV
jgi:hypothetical protein